MRAAGVTETLFPLQQRRQATAADLADRLGVSERTILSDVEIGADVPEHLQPYWDWEFCSFHSPEWWRTHWAKTGKVSVDTADAVPDGWKDWQRFNKLSMPYMTGWLAEATADTELMLEADQGRYLGFTRVVATKLDSTG